MVQPIMQNFIANSMEEQLISQTKSVVNNIMLNFPKFTLEKKALTGKIIFLIIDVCQGKPLEVALPQINKNNPAYRSLDLSLSHISFNYNWLINIPLSGDLKRVEQTRLNSVIYQTVRNIIKELPNKDQYGWDAASLREVEKMKVTKHEYRSDFSLDEPRRTRAEKQSRSKISTLRHARLGRHLKQNTLSGSDSSPER